MITLIRNKQCLVSGFLKDLVGFGLVFFAWRCFASKGPRLSSLRAHITCSFIQQRWPILIWPHVLKKRIESLTLNAQKILRCKDLDTNAAFVYSLTSSIRHSFIQHSRYYDTFWRDQTFQFKTPSSIRLRHLIMRHLEFSFCHIKEGVNAKFFFHLSYVHKKYIHFHLRITWELNENHDYLWRMDMVRVGMASNLVFALYSW